MSPSERAESHIKRGLLWLGSASALARAADALGMVAVLWFVSRAELGQATLAWSVTVLLEAFNGLGVGTAMLQVESLREEQCSAAFWYALAVGAALASLATLASGAIAGFYGSPALRPLIVASATKLVFVGAALVPLQRLNRALRYAELAAVQSLATLGSVALCVALAALGLGAWALVLGHCAHGLLTAGAAFALTDYRPRGRPSLAAVGPLARSGLKVACSGAVFHFYRNADYLLLGRFLGVSSVGVYRVAFDLAMAPAQALLGVVNRAAFPAYARLRARPERLAEALLWTTRTLALLLAPASVLLFVAADDLLSLIDGGRWRDAAPILRWLAVAGWLRGLAQLLPQVMHARARSELAIVEALASLAVLAALFGALLWGWGADYGPVVLGWGWAAAYVPLLAVGLALCRLVIPLEPARWLAALGPALGGGALAALACAGLGWLPLHSLSAGARLALWALGCVTPFALWARFGLGASLRDLLPSRTEAARA